MILINNKKIYYYISNSIDVIMQYVFTKTYYNEKIFNMLSILTFLIYIIIIILFCIYFIKLGNNWNNLLDIHNKIRKYYNLQLLEWDDELAITASDWTTHCVADDDTGFFKKDMIDAGQNMAEVAKDFSCIDYDGTDCKKNIDYKTAAGYFWNSECTTFINNKSELIQQGNWNFLYDVEPVKEIGHFTQQIWSTSDKIGCGTRKCTSEYLPNASKRYSAKEVYNSPYMHNVSCYYSPPGNQANDNGIMNFNKYTPAKSCIEQTPFLLNYLGISSNSN
jgi:hypothetical protein